MVKDLRTTDKVQELQRKLYQKAKSDIKFRFYALYDKVYRKDVLLKAWNKVKRNNGACGIDKQTFKGIEEEGVLKFLDKIHQELKGETYRPQQLRRVNIPKADGKKRPVSIPTIRDRVVQAALKLIIEPIFESNFEESSYGFRPNRSCHHAVLEVRKYLNYGYNEIIETDIADCFGTIPHRELLEMVAKRICDKKILRLIKLFLKAGVLESGKEHKTGKGTPQGGVISPLLANIYLDNIDKGWKPMNQYARLIRYADDLIIMTKYKAGKYKEHLERMIRRMKLQVKAEKTRIVNAEERTFDFLGFSFVKGRNWRKQKKCAYFFPSHKSEKAIRHKIREVLNYNRPIRIEYIIKELEPILRGWVNYYRIGNSSKKFGKLRNYVGQRVRKFMCRSRGKSGYGYKKYTEDYLYRQLGLYQDYRICHTNTF